jgi:adenylyltransferase/sulfurtransferase
VNTRYSRQTVLPEIGQLGQSLLGKARILVVGAGGLAAPALLYLAAAGVGRRADEGCLGLIDDDIVDTSNLQRQILYTESDQNRPKTVAAAERLQALNHEINIVSYAERLDTDNILDVFTGYDIIIDGSDNFATKYLINDAAVKTGKPVVYGSILGFEGQVAVFSAAHGPCYRCLYPEQVQSHIPNCAEAGTIGSIAGVIGSIQALEACKLALGEAHCRQYGLEPLIGKLLVFDARNWDTRVLMLNKNPDCALCTQVPEQIQLQPSHAASCATPDIKTINLSDLNDLYDIGAPVTLIDVREIAEWDSGHLNDAMHLPLTQLLALDDDSDQLTKDCLIVVYCQHGIRSLRAAQHLNKLGFNALNLKVFL